MRRRLLSLPSEKGETVMVEISDAGWLIQLGGHGRDFTGSMH